MKRAHPKIPEITEEEPTINEFVGLNTFGPHADLRPGEFRDLKNFDNFGDYIKTRRGSKVLITDFCPAQNILSHAVFDAGDKEYAVIQQTDNVNSEFRFVELIAGGTWTDVVQKDDLTSFTMPITSKVDMFVSNQKVYIFHAAGNSILEFDDPTFPDGFVRRKMGLPGPQITSIVITDEAVADRGLDGKRVWAAELVYKNTDVTPNVDIIVSGPNRAILVVDPSFKEGRFAYASGTAKEYTVKISPTLNDGTLITDIENSNWTHIRLYRSKDVTTATNAVPDLQGPAEIIGRDDELFQVQEIDKTTFLATLSGGVYTFDLDFVQDDDVPFPLDVITGSRLDMYPMPPADIGTFHRNRIWVSGVTMFPGPAGAYALDSIEAKIFYSPETNTQYSESVQALNAIESEPGDGEKMKKLVSFQEDLLGIKEGKTGRVPYGDPDSGWVTEDHVIGISDKDFAQFVPNVGICAIVNDQQDFRIFGYDLAWHSDFAGLQISRPIRDIISTFSATDLDFLYMNGKLFISGGQGLLLVLAVEQKRGWSIYEYPFNNLSETVFTFNEGRRALVLNGGQRGIEIEVDDLDTDYDATIDQTVAMEYFITTHRWQELGGRALIEQRWISMVAILRTNASFQPFVNGKLWDVPFNLLLDPTAYPFAELQETEYQGYSEFKPVGNYIHYDISGKAPATIYSIMLNCLVQRHQIAPGFDPFEILEFVDRKPPWNSDLIIKDAATEDRDNADFVKNDADDETRTNADIQKDDAGDEDRSE